MVDYSNPLEMDKNMKRKIDKKGTLLSAIFAKKLSTWLVVLLLISLIPVVIPVVKISQASSVSWYVATTGSDSAAGDISNPFKTIQQGVNKAQPGDTIYVRGGTYNKWVQMVRSGTAGSPITIAGYPGETAIIDGTGVSTGGDPIVWTKAYSYLTFKDFTIQNVPNSFGLGTNYDESTSPSHDITIYGCHFKNVLSNAIYFWKQSNTATYPMTNMIVSHCSFDTIQTTGSSNECCTFRGCKNSLFEYNTMTNIRQIGVGICESTYCTIDHNTIDGSAMRSVAACIYVDGGQESGAKSSYITVSNNYVYGSGQCIGYGIEASNAVVDHLTIVNNVISTTNSGILTVNEASGTFSNVVIIHNTIVGGSGIQVSSANIVANNIVYGGSIYAANAIIINNLATNPLFVSPGSNFHLQAGSPAIGAASSTYVSSAYHSLTDFDGKTRVTPYDIGAYEYDGTGSGGSGSGSSGSGSSGSASPVISQVGLTNSSTLDIAAGYGWENFTCVVTDNDGESTVLLQLTNPDQSTTNIPMTKKTGTTTYYTQQSLNKKGEYSYRFQVTDTNENIVLSSSYTFSLLPDWDINNDGIVTISDLVLVSNHYGETGPKGWIPEDVDHNGIVQSLDIVLVANNFEKSWWT
jgi:Dockerin type I domain/Protein of unknown function (DUF1565)